MIAVLMTAEMEMGGVLRFMPLYWLWWGESSSGHAGRIAGDSTTTAALILYILMASCQFVAVAQDSVDLLSTKNAVHFVF